MIKKINITIYYEKEKNASIFGKTKFKMNTKYCDKLFSFPGDRIYISSLLNIA